VQADPDTHIKLKKKTDVLHRLVGQQYWQGFLTFIF
jgi:hypothetical protein